MKEINLYPDFEGATRKLEGKTIVWDSCNGIKHGATNQLIKGSKYKYSSSDFEGAMNQLIKGSKYSGSVEDAQNLMIEKFKERLNTSEDKVEVFKDIIQTIKANLFAFGFVRELSELADYKSNKSFESTSEEEEEF